MPIFNNRAGNAGTGRGLLTTIGHRREAVKGLKSAVGSSNFSQGFNRGSGFNPGLTHSPTNPLSPAKNAFNEAPTAQVGRARSGAMAAGLSSRKVSRVLNRAEKKAMKPNGRYAQGLKAGAQSAHDAFPFK